MKRYGKGGGDIASNGRILLGIRMKGCAVIGSTKGAPEGGRVLDFKKPLF